MAEGSQKRLAVKKERTAEFCNNLKIDFNSDQIFSELSSAMEENCALKDQVQ
jgi:hypothetical protein